VEPFDKLTTSSVHLAISGAPPFKQVDNILPTTGAAAAPMDDILSATTTRESITFAETPDDYPTTSAISALLIPSQPPLLDVICILNALDGCVNSFNSVSNNVSIFTEFPIWMTLHHCMTNLLLL
jgi:hypothetical protein